MSKSVKVLAWDFFNKYRGVKDVQESIAPFIYSIYKYAHERLGISNIIDFDSLTYQRYKNQIDVYKKVPESFLESLQISTIRDYKNIVDYLIDNANLYQGRLGSENFSPNNINVLISKLVGSVDSFGDLTAGVGGTIREVLNSNPRAHFTGIELKRDVALLAELKFAFDDNVTIENSNSVESGLFNKVDAIAMIPPFGMRSPGVDMLEEDFPYGLPSKSNFNFGWLQLALNNLNEKGKAVVLLSQNSLFTTNKYELEVRKNLIEAKLVEAIVSLPAKVFNSSGIKTSIWVLNKDKKSDSVLMIDTSSLATVKERNTYFSEEAIAMISDIYQKTVLRDEVSWSVSIDEVRENGYSLYPEAYLDVLRNFEFSNKVLLKDLVRSVKTETLNKEDAYRIIGIKDLSNKVDSFKLDIQELEVKSSIKNHVLFNGKGLLLATIGGKLKPTFLDTNGEEIAVQKNIAIFKVNENAVFIDYLVQELHKDYVKVQVDAFSKGVVISHISKKEILSLVVDLANLLDQQKEIVEKEKRVRFEKLALESGFQEQLEAFKREQILDLGAKKHNINQHLNNVKASAEVLKEIMFHKKTGISLDDIINPRRGITVGNRLELLLESINQVVYYVDNLTNESEFSKKEPLDIVELIDNCIRLKGDIPNYKIDFYTDKEIDEYILNISKKDFVELFNNIIENAENHGFIELGKQYRVLIILTIENNHVKLTIQNDGKPFPKGMSNSYRVKGEKAGETANTGIGSWKVSEIAKHFGAELTVIDEPEEVFPVGIQLVFKNQ